MPPSIKQPHCATSPPPSSRGASEPSPDVGENGRQDETPAAPDTPDGLAGTQESREGDPLFPWKMNNDDYHAIPRDPPESSGSLSVQAGSSRSDSLIEPDQDGPTVSNHGDLVPHLPGTGPHVPPIVPALDASVLNYVGTSDTLMATFLIADTEIAEDSAAIMEG